MSNTYYKQYQAFTNREVHGMVDFAAIKSGIDILNSNGDPESPRMRMAAAIADTPDVLDFSTTDRSRALQAFVKSIVTNGAILTSLYEGDVLTPGNALGNDLEFVISGQWDVVAESIYPEPGPEPEPED